METIRRRAGDLALAAAFALPALVVFEGTIRTTVVALFVVSIGYTLIRKSHASLGE